MKYLKLFEMNSDDVIKKKFRLIITKSIFILVRNNVK